MSLRLRVVAAIIVLLLTGSVVGVALAGWQASQVLDEELAAAIAGARQSVAGSFASLARSDDPRRDIARLVAAFDGDRHLRVSLIDRQGRILAVSRPLPAAPAPAAFTALFRPAASPVRLAAPAGMGGEIVLEPMPANDLAAIWAEFVDLVGVLSLSLLLGSGLVWLTVGRALRPLSDVSAAFVRIGSGDYSAEVPEAGPREMVRLGRGVNEMTARLAAMQARTRRLEEQLRTLQDEERADLARDLHDEIGPHLFTVNVDAAMARSLIGEGRIGEALGRLDAIQAAVGHMQRLVRDILGRLRPTELIELGLKAAIEALVAFWRARHPAIAFTLRVPEDADLPLAEEAREALYRVVQEGLNNAVRHGRPGRVDVEITSGPSGEVQARISDDGPPSPAQGTVGYGLKGMRERVQACDGLLSIETGPAGGWTVAVRLAAFPRGDGLEEAGQA